MNKLLDAGVMLGGAAVMVASYLSIISIARSSTIPIFAETYRNVIVFIW